ncbi:hypothetical protein AX16_002678 [Volvariella volvacea WC 439]|nr:hypothetical protein AX16_002678 [Volvariella volvacea WC 439]
MAKSPRSHSLAVLSYMSNNNITGVRGNHDQAVIEWRGWVNWINSLPGGQQWLQSEHQSWHKARSKGIKLKVWQEQQRNTGDKKWWRKIPKGWKLFGDHYMIAEGMKKEDYEYLLRLPLKLHVPDAHLFLAHAGLLASDPRFSPSSKRQPLAKLPVIPPTFRRVVADLEGHEERKRFDNNTEVMRHLQEAAILRDVPQNNDPWVTLNMRSVFKGRITRTKKGKRWSKLWNRDMSHCDGFDQVRHDKNALPCYPSTVIYGHAAAWGLDVKRWSFGLDSGCVYKRELTAMILNGRDPLSSEWDMAALGDFDEYDYEDDVEDQFFDDEWDLEEEDDDADEIMDDDSEDDGSNDAKKKQQTRIVPFGDNMRARVVSISCR